MTDLLKDEVQLFKISRASLDRNEEYMNGLAELREQVWNNISNN